MCAADEVALMDTMDGANLDASTTACAKRVINGGQIIDHLDGTVRASLLALHTADTAVDAVLARGGTLFMVGTLHDHAGGVVD